MVVEELKRSFGVRHVKDYGACIVIPKGKFNIEWEDALWSEGVIIHYNIDLPGGENCTVLQLKQEHLQNKQHLVYEPKPNPSPWRDPEKFWKPEEDALLIELYNKGIRIKEIAKRFPNRSEQAVHLRLQRLRKAGKINRRLKRDKQLQQSQNSETFTSELADLLKQIQDCLKPKSFSFAYACPNCNIVGSASKQDRIWRFCPNCGKPLTVYNVEVSQ